MKARRLSALVRPWGAGWQLWSRGRKAPAWTLAQEGELTALKIPADVFCAVPARFALAFPFWLEATEESVVREMALLEVEMRGLASGDRLRSDVEIHLLRAEEGKTLVRAVVYPADWPAHLPSLHGAGFGASPALAVLGDDTVHLWREGDDLVAAVMWRGVLVGWDTTDANDDEGMIASWLNCLRLQLREELGITESLRLRDWTGIFAETPGGFRSDRGFTENDRAQGAIPVLPGSEPWLPFDLRQAARVRRERMALARAAGGALAALAVLALAVGFALAGLHWKERQADQEIARLENAIAPIRHAALRWSRIESAVDERFFPLEMLHVVVASLPSTGVRLTMFEMSPEKILVEGEAGNVGAATEFFQKLRQNPEAGGVEWEMPSPALQANNTARFIINGARGEGGHE